MATHNQGKVAELRELLRDTGWTCGGLPDGTPDFPEDGDTFGENARGKALFYAEHVGAVALADDSGLMIDALDGEPGVYSARYIDPAISQEERNAAVLDRLRGIPPQQRGAQFVCHLVLARSGDVVRETTGVCQGAITNRVHGDGGFGYDPIFRPAGHTPTFAEMPRATKSALSHRGQAVAAMVDFLRNCEPEPGVS